MNTTTTPPLDFEIFETPAAPPVEPALIRLLVEQYLGAETVVTLTAFREQLMCLRRDAISIVRMTENMLDLPADQRAIRTRKERRNLEGPDND